MSRLSGLKAGVRRVNVAGLARVALAGGAAFALVHVATTQSLDLDLVAASGEEPVVVPGTSLATRVTQVCPGPELTGIPGAPDVTVPASVVAESGPADLLPSPPEGEGTLSAASGATTLFSVDRRPGSANARLPEGAPVRLTGEGALAPAFAATQEWRVDTKELRGLVTVPCTAGDSDLWLLAGGAGPGRQERLVLTNPGANPVTAQVTVHGEAGPLGEPLLENVAPGSRVSLLLDAFHGEEQQPAVHVSAAGGGISATLTDTWVDGSTPLGAETTIAAAAPATEQVVPGAVVGDVPASLRVAVPGEEGAVVRVSILGDDGPVPTTGGSVLSVGPGGVGELPLEGVPAGTYAVALSSDAPVVASVFSRSGDGQEPGDFAWSPAAEPLGTVGGAAFQEVGGLSRTLHLLSSDGNADVEVITVLDGAPRSRTLDLLADRLATVPLDGATSVWVRRTGGSGDVRGTVLSASGEGPARFLSAMPLEESVVASAVSRAVPRP